MFCHDLSSIRIPLRRAVFLFYNTIDNINNEIYNIFEKLINMIKISEIYSKMGSKWGIDDFVA